LISAVVLTYMTVLLAGMLGLPGAELFRRDRIGERAAGVEVRDQNGLLGERIEAVSAMKCTPQKAMISASVAAPWRLRPSESPT